MANLLQLLRNLALVPDVPIEQTKKADGGRIEPAGLQVSTPRTDPPCPGLLFFRF